MTTTGPTQRTQDTSSLSTNHPPLNLNPNLNRFTPPTHVVKKEGLP
ncbi:hypothetical protein SBV1_350022 [Verrucomicrobia bacterium]|nr:hypothetical protein SBV1_350022 [Verrucomicrobiota bacterium]